MSHRSHSSTELWLIRHGQTAWSLTGRHTGRTDVPLTHEGEAIASSVHRHLHGRPFSLVLTSPLIRARETARIAGYGEVAEVDPDLAEWNYGELEGRTTSDIEAEYPGWSIWKGPWPKGETLEEVAVRARRVIQRCMEVDGPVALFAHGHFLRVLTACWLQRSPEHGQLFALDVASVSRLGWEHKIDPVIHSWNWTEQEHSKRADATSPQ